MAEWEISRSHDLLVCQSLPPPQAMLLLREMREIGRIRGEHEELGNEREARPGTLGNEREARAEVDDEPLPIFPCTPSLRLLIFLRSHKRVTGDEAVPGSSLAL